MTSQPNPLYMAIDPTPRENPDVRWYSSGEATEPMTCNACGQQLGNTPFSIGDDGARHQTCPDGESPGR